VASPTFCRDGDAPPDHLVFNPNRVHGPPSGLCDCERHQVSSLARQVLVFIPIRSSASQALIGLPNGILSAPLSGPATAISCLLAPLSTSSVSLLNELVCVLMLAEAEVVFDAGRLGGDALDLWFIIIISS
jgi:hypothetical protein